MAKGRSRLLGAWSLLGRGMPVWLATDDPAGDGVLARRARRLGEPGHSLVAERWRALAGGLARLEGLR